MFKRIGPRPIRLSFLFSLPQPADCQSPFLFLNMGKLGEMLDMNRSIY